MRTLHVAALPFPSPQGTQALLHQMLSALEVRGHDTHLLCYAHGAASRVEDLGSGAYTVHRVPTRSFSGSLRSGPSLDKVWLDLGLARELARLSALLAPDLIVAHHVEAAAACALALRDRRVLFVAHTSLADELPTYVPEAWGPLARKLGAGVDRSLTRRSHRTVAVSPVLAELLSTASARTVESLPLPWPLATPIVREAALAARAALGLSESAEVTLYAGNLDGYQGLSALLPGLALAADRRPALRLLIATESDPRALQRALRAADLLDRTHFSPLADEGARRLVHAAADCALVPRLSVGGVPIKLLDALARGVPVVASRTALAGYALDAYCACVDEQTPARWAEAIACTLDDRASAHACAAAGRAYIGQRHTAEQFTHAIERYARS
ncbi:MAG: hypothetical protein RLZZ450_1924 [Pseudomonadota bacterium]|jgi:glycosyltransferase involved in cell wall biosynthesis